MLLGRRLHRIDRCGHRRLAKPLHLFQKRRLGLVLEQSHHKLDQTSDRSHAGKELHLQLMGVVLLRLELTGSFLRPAYLCR